ncbi:MAG: hypothetical protein HYV07_08920 [Deltaproteobacteria bacterium]|nr:hypothetical protein [Deltaproteobacteria bacterium]
MALLYRQELAELGLGAGPIPMAEATARSVPFPLPTVAFANLLDRDGGIGRWSETMVSPEMLLRYPIERRNACADWYLETLPLDTSANPWTAVALDAESGLIVTDKYHRVSKGGATEVEPLIPGVDVTAAFRRSAEELWLSGSAGRLFRSIGGELTEFEPSPVGSAPGEMDGSPSDQDLEIYVRHPDGTIARFDGEVWSTYPGEPTGLGSLSWVAAGEVIAVGKDDEAVRRIRDGVTTFEAVGDGSVGLSASANIPGLGLIVADVFGSLYQHADGRWGRFAKPGAWMIRALCPTGSGLVAGGSFGWLVAYSPEGGFCDLPTGPSSVRKIVPVGDTFLVAWENQQWVPEPGGPRTFYSWIRHAP